MQWQMSLSIMHNDAITKHDHNVIVQTVIVTQYTYSILLKQASRGVSHELNNMTKFLIRLIVNGGEIFLITRQTDH